MGIGEQEAICDVLSFLSLMIAILRCHGGVELERLHRNVDNPDNGDAGLMLAAGKTFLQTI